MTKYRKKPVVVEAVRYNGLEMVDDTPEPMFDLSFEPPMWILEAQGKSEDEPGSMAIASWAEESLVFQSRDGLHYAMPGDWIIIDDQGDIYSYKADIFTAIYEEVGSERPAVPDVEQVEAVAALEPFAAFARAAETVRRFSGRAISDEHVIQSVIGEGGIMGVLTYGNVLDALAAFNGEPRSWSGKYRKLRAALASQLSNEEGEGA